MEKRRKRPKPTRRERRKTASVTPQQARKRSRAVMDQSTRRIGSSKKHVAQTRRAIAKSRRIGTRLAAGESGAVVDRCPKCGSDVTASTWRAHGMWINAAGERLPERRRTFRPAQCANRHCDWEGPSDEAALREAKERAEEQ